MRGQSALDGFDPNANDLVRVIVLQPDGKILIGGDFTTLSPNGGAAVTRNHIARLNPDGTLDTAFNPNANGLVLAIALQADGKILVGGAFTNIGGQPRNRMARLDASGSADSFDPSPNDFVFAIALQADGKILVGGDFRGANSIGGQMRNRMARLDPATGLADPFDPSASATVHSIVVQADGKILVGGEFTGIGGQPRNRMARLDVAMGAADSFDPSANGTVDTIALQADGKILVGGEFHGANSIGGQTRTGVARLDATTGLADSSFNPNPAPFNAIVYAIALQADGKILAGGTFTSIGGQPRVRLARLDAVTGLADSLDPNANGGSFPAVLAIAVQADGKIIAGGAFTALTPNGGAAVTRNRIARLETDGLLDKTLNLNVTGSQIGSGVYATAIQRDGKILIGGKFETVLGVTRNNIARLNTDGTLDMAFNPNASNTVNAIAVQMDGKILVGGDFNGPSFLTTIGGQSRNYIARLDATSGQADSFDPQASATVNSIALQADAKILVGGVFSTIGGQPRNRIARLDPGTGQADPFDPNPTGTNTYVNSVVVQADGKILVGGGGFTGIGGQPRNRIARLDPATGLADSFDPSADNTVNAIALQADGKVLAGGVFSNIGGQPRSRIARLDATTGLADSFNPNAIPNATVFSIVVQADGKILVAGSFLTIGGQSRMNLGRLDPSNGLADSFDANARSLVRSLALQTDGKVLAGGAFNSIGNQTRNLFGRLTNDTAAIQQLALTQTSISWARSGSSAQLTRVTFEHSTDNVNYSLLGNGTADGSNWSLTGLSFPIGQNFYVRASGYYHSGQENGSENITESVRNAFILPVLKILSITRDPNGHILLQCLGVPNQVNNLQVSPDLSPGSFMTIFPSPNAADGTGAFPYDDAAAVGFTKRFYRLTYP